MERDSTGRESGWMATATKSRAAGWWSLATPLVILASILVIYLPLPAGWLDLLLAANLCASVLILLTAVFARSPLEFSLFPSLLLVTTLSRIALNVATTRLILARGPIDHELAAGEVVRSFGQVVAGDQLAVGLVVFLILFIVQFMVITHGTSRIGEVAARFALDGLPGRQMAIDADLSAGLINHEQARSERRRLLDSAEFYGSMDGASKYVRGDAVAGLCITVINLVGGIGFGLSQGMSLTTAMDTFSKLTIGDGLCSQLPALMISLAAGLLVARGSSDTDFPDVSVRQLTARPIALLMTAGLMMLFLFARMPLLPISGLAVVLVGIAWMGGSGRSGTEALPGAAAAGAANSGQPTEKTMERLLEANPLQLELGRDLLVFADATAGGTLLARVSQLRQEIASRLGMILPKVRVCDNLGLAPGEFRILLDDAPVLQARIPAGSVLELGSSPVARPGEEPAPLGLPWARAAVWIRRELAGLSGGRASLDGVDVMIRSIEWVVEANAASLLTLDSLQQLLDETRKQHPVLVEETFGNRGAMTAAHWIFRSLVGEGVPLRPMHQVLEAMLEARSRNLDPASTLAMVRRTMGRVLCRQLRDDQRQLPCFGLSEELERRLADAQDQAGREPPLQISIAQSLVRSVETGIRHMQQSGLRPVMVVRPSIRATVAGLLAALRPGLHVLAEDEVDPSTRLEMIARIRLGDLQENAPANAAA